MKRLVLTAVLLTALFALGSGFALADDGDILARIQERGELICGVNSVLPGFGTQNDAGDFEGFDVDICRAVAAAILGDANAIAFRPLAAAERPTALASGEIDMMSRNTTWTLSPRYRMGRNPLVLQPSTTVRASWLRSNSALIPLKNSAKNP